jgi:type 1 fimbria pilin
MKKTFIAAALMVCAGSAFAEPTAVLQVQGKLTNASCTPELSNGGEVDYGYIHLSTLSATAVNLIGKRSLDLTINCTVATKVAWTANDNRSDSNAKVKVDFVTEDYYQYGVGKTDAGVNIGDYTLMIESDTVVDGATVQTVGRNSSSEGWRKMSGLRSDGVTSLTVVNAGSLEPLAFRTATIPLTTTLAIQPTDTLAITDDTPIDGQATITLQYL